jgi:ketosteroid isomerase-like protein
MVALAPSGQALDRLRPERWPSLDLAVQCHDDESRDARENARMPDEDFEVVRRAWAAASCADEEAMVREWHPEVVAVPFGAAMEGKTYRGREEVLGWWRDEILVSWEFFEVIPEGFQRVGEKLLVTGHWNARGKGSGVELDIQASWVIEVRDGKIAYWQTYTEHAQARRDIGLEG